MEKRLVKILGFRKCRLYLTLINNHQVSEHHQRQEARIEWEKEENGFAKIGVHGTFFKWEWDAVEISGADVEGEIDVD